MVDDPERNYLFVCGCARSGTSALVQLLSGSDEIVLGMERFGHLVQKDDFRLKKAMFSREHFFNVHEGETFYTDFDSRHSFDPRIREKFDTCLYIGDKRPDLYLAYDELFAEFPEAKVLFIYRDVREVASSYEGRVVRGDNWPASKDFSKAVVEWNQSLHFTRLGIEKGYDIRVLRYSDVFSSEKSLRAIFDFLGVPYSEEVQQHVGRIRERARELKGGRLMLLSEEQEQYVISNAKEFMISDIESYRLL